MVADGLDQSCGKDTVRILDRVFVGPSPAGTDIIRSSADRMPHLQEPVVQVDASDLQSAPPILSPPIRKPNQMLSLLPAGMAWEAYRSAQE